MKDKNKRVSDTLRRDKQIQGSKESRFNDSISKKEKRSRERAEKAELDKAVNDMIIKENQKKYQSKLDKAESDLSNKIKHFEDIR